MYAPSVIWSFPRRTAPASSRRSTTVALKDGMKALKIVVPAQVGEKVV